MGGVIVQDGQPLVEMLGRCARDDLRWQGREVILYKMTLVGWGSFCTR
jgi:hypothetical protein